MKKNKFSKFKSIYQNKWLIGFEIECYFDDKTSLFQIKKNIRKFNKKILFTYDDSLDALDNKHDIEIITPPLKSIDAINLLKNILDYIKENGVTTKDCGLHVNLSPISNRIYNRLNPLKIFRCQKIINLAKKYKRHKNRTCNTSKELLKIAKKYENGYKLTARQILSLYNYGCWSNDMEDDTQHLESIYDKFNAININCLDFPRKKESRIEVRVIGNKNYHKKFSTIAKDVNTIVKSLNTALKKS